MIIRAQSTPAQVIDCLDKLAEMIERVLNDSALMKVSQFQDVVMVSYVYNRVLVADF